MRILLTIYLAIMVYQWAMVVINVIVAKGNLFREFDRLMDILDSGDPTRIKVKMILWATTGLCLWPMYAIYYRK